MPEPTSFTQDGEVVSIVELPEVPPVDLPKRLKIVVGTNSLTESQYPAYSNHIQLWYRFGRSYPHIDFILVNPARMAIDRMRNMAAKVALEYQADYLLFLDDDVLAPVDGLHKLIQCEADIAAGKVCIRGYPFDYMIFRNKPGLDERGLYPLSDLPNDGIEDCGAVGFSFCLIKTEVFKTMPAPYFVTGMNNTEDIYFCVKAKMANPDVKIKVHCGIDCAHILWPETISATNKKTFKEYFETMNPGCGEPEVKGGDRGNSYLEMVKEVTETKEEVPVET